MNASLRKIAAVAPALLGAGLLSACAGAFDASTDQASPIAPRVQALVDAHRQYPRWADFPRATPAPEPAQIALQVNTLRASSGALAGEVARIDWQLTDDPSVYAAEARARVAATTVDPVSADTQAEIEEFVRRSRERGRAPPPVDRR